MQPVSAVRAVRSSVVVLALALAACASDDLNRAEAERAKRRGTEDLEAWALFQLGLQHADAFRAPALAQARWQGLAAHRRLGDARHVETRFAGAVQENP